MRAVAVTQRVSVLAGYGERQDCLDQAWTRFLAACGLLPVLLPNVGEAALALCEGASVAGLVMIGGNDLAMFGGDAPERDEVENALLDLAERRRLPGVCRGMQVIQQRFTISPRRVEGHVTPPQTIRIHGEPKVVNSYHHFAAFDSRPPLDVWAVADDGVVKAILNGTPYVVERGGKKWSGPRPEQARRHSKSISFLDRMLIFALFYDNFAAWNYPCPKIFSSLVVRSTTCVLLLLTPMKMEVIAAASAVVKCDVLPSWRSGNARLAMRRVAQIVYYRLAMMRVIAAGCFRRLRAKKAILQTQDAYDTDDHRRAAACLRAGARRCAAVLALRMVIGQARQDVGEPSLGIDVVELTSLCRLPNGFVFPRVHRDRMWSARAWFVLCLRFQQRRTG